MVYGLYRALPGEPGFLATVAREKMLFANLMPASGHQDHTTLPSASSAFVRSAISVHRDPSHVDDVAQRPSFGTGWQIR